MKKVLLILSVLILSFDGVFATDNTPTSRGARDREDFSNVEPSPTRVRVALEEFKTPELGDDGVIAGLSPIVPGAPARDHQNYLDSPNGINVSPLVLNLLGDDEIAEDSQSDEGDNDSQDLLFTSSSDENNRPVMFEARNLQLHESNATHVMGAQPRLRRPRPLLSTRNIHPTELPSVPVVTPVRNNIDIQRSFFDGYNQGLEDGARKLGPVLKVGDLFTRRDGDVYYKAPLDLKKVDTPEETYLKVAEAMTKFDNINLDNIFYRNINVFVGILMAFTGVEHSEESYEMVLKAVVGILGIDYQDDDKDEAN